MEGTGNSVEDCKHALLPDVTITSADQRAVTFMVRSDGASNPDQALLRTFTVALSELYTGPVDKLPAKPVELTPGARGPLYLTREGWATQSADGFGIFDFGRAIFKWPDCAGIATAVCMELSVIPTSIWLYGHVEGETDLVHIELLGHDATAAQDVFWTGADYVELHLTERGARRLHVKSRSTRVRFWPTRMVVRGAPAIDPSVSGEVDVLNSELADSKQHIRFARHGAPITLSLTQDGITAFHVTPQAVAELACEIENGAHAQVARSSR